MKFCIKITHDNGLVSYLSHKDKTAWCKVTAKKYLSEWLGGIGKNTIAELEEA